VDWTKLDFACQLGAHLSIVAGYCEVSEDVIEDRVSREKGLTFRAYRDQKMAGIRLKLIQKAMSKAFDGDNCMLIFCLKNQCGWADKVDHGFHADKKQIVLKYSLDEKSDGPDSDRGPVKG